MDHQRNSARNVLSAILAAVAVIVLGVMGTSTAHAQYPPAPPSGGQETPVEPDVDSEVSSRGPEAPTQGSASPTQGTLPSTGGSGVTTALTAAGIALMLGIAVTVWSKTSTRRHANSA